RKRRTPENTILSQPYCRRVSTDRPNRISSLLAASFEGTAAQPARVTVAEPVEDDATKTRLWS
ncbi:unnamed protein product, partial [Ascophyllum nodosum]